MRTRRILSIVLVLVLLASAVPMAVMPVAAIYEEKLPCDDGDNELTQDELTSAILPYMLGEGTFKLDDVGDASYVYAYWNGKPKTIIDQAEREVTFYRPIERAVSLSADPTKIVIALGTCDKLVGISSYCTKCLTWAAYGMREEEPSGKTAKTANICDGRLFELPVVSGNTLELIVSLNPDVVFGSSRTADAMQGKTGIPTVCAVGSGGVLERTYKMIGCVGKILEKEEEAEELILFYEEKLDEVREVTSEINESEKPKVYISGRAHYGVDRGFGKTLARFEPLSIAGGINVAKDCAGSGAVTVSKEQVVAWAPDIILLTRWTLREGEVTQYGVMGGIEDVCADPLLQTMDAVKNGKVYYVMNIYCVGMPPHPSIVNTLYLAKIFYSDKFENLDLEKEGNEIYERFLGVDGLYTEEADYSIWLREYLDSQK